MPTIYYGETGPQSLIHTQVLFQVAGMRLVFIFGYFQAGCWHSTRLAVPHAAGCLLLGSADWLSLYYSLMQWGDKLTGTVIIKWLGGNQCAKQNLSLRKQMSAKSGNIHEMENGLAEDVRKKWCEVFVHIFVTF